MPTFYLLNEAEKNTVFKMREGIKSLTIEDIKKINERADVMYWAWIRKPRAEVYMPQDRLDYWVAVASFEYTLEQLGIKPQQ